MNSSAFRNASGSVVAGGLVASLLSAIAVYLVSSSAPLARGSVYLFARHVTFSSVIFAAIFAVLWQSCGILIGLYGSARESGTSNFTKAFECSISMTVLLGLCMAITTPRPPLVRVLPAFLGCALALELVRLSIGVSLRERSRRVVIVGCDRLAAKAWREFRVHPGQHMQVVGFVNQTASEEMMPDIASRCLGDLDALPRIILDQDIDDVVVAACAGLHSRLEQSIARAGSLGTRILCLKDICGIHPESIAKNHGDILFELVPAPRLSGFEQTSKRIFDVTVSATVLLLASFLLLPVAILSLGQRRPITFRPSVQLGFRRRKYRCWHLDMAPGGHRVQLFLDMLPSMWNVLCGHMSLVGPLPIFEADIAQAETATLAGRFNVRPGVIGSHIGHSIPTALATDTSELSDWSLLTDLKTLTRACRIGMERSVAIESEAGAQ